MARKLKSKAHKLWKIMYRENLNQPWEVLSVDRTLTEKQVRILMEDLKRNGPKGCGVTLCICEPIGLEEKPPSNEKPRWVTHPIKKENRIKSSAEWLNDNEVVAICNECGCVGPKVTRDSNGNELLAKEGWEKEERPSLFSAPICVLRCPTCAEEYYLNSSRKDWF